MHHTAPPHQHAAEHARRAPLPAEQPTPHTPPSQQPPAAAATVTDAQPPPPHHTPTSTNSAQQPPAASSTPAVPPPCVCVTCGGVCMGGGAGGVEARWLAQQNARLLALSRAVGEAAEAAHDNNEAIAQAAAFLALRKAVMQTRTQDEQLLASSPHPHSSHRATCSIAGGASPLLPLSQLHLDGLVSQIEVQLLGLLSAINDAKRRSAERYQSMIHAMQKQCRARIAQVEQKATARVTATEQRCVDEVNALREECRAMEEGAAKQLQQQQEEAALALQRAADQLNSTASQYESQVESLREQLSSVQSENQRLQSVVCEKDELARRSLREASEKHAHDLRESLTLFERKQRMELEAVREAARQQLEEKEREMQRSVEAMKRSQKDELERVQFQYMEQLESVSRDHAAQMQQMQMQQQHTLMQARRHTDVNTDTREQQLQQLQQANEAALAAQLQNHSRSVAMLEVEHQTAVRVLEAKIEQLQRALKDASRNGSSRRARQRQEEEDESDTSGGESSDPRRSTRLHADGSLIPLVQHEAELTRMRNELIETRAQVDELQRQRAEAERDKEQQIAQLEEKHEKETAELKGAASSFESAQAEVLHHKSYAEQLAERWRALSAEHERLQEQHDELRRASEAAEQERQAEERNLKQRIVEVEQARQQAVDSLVRVRAELMDAHANERKQWERQQAAQKEEAALHLAAALSESSASHQRELLRQRQALEQEFASQLKQCKEHYEHMLRVSDRSLQQQAASLRALEARERQFQSLAAAQDQRLQELHRIHVEEQRLRMEQWRAQRRKEMDDAERWLERKMEAIQWNHERREEALCQACRTKAGASSFRAALHRLCDEAAHPYRYRSLLSAADASPTSPNSVSAGRVASPVRSPIRPCSPPSAKACSFTSPSKVAAKYFAQRGVWPAAMQQQQQSPGAGEQQHHAKQLHDSEEKQTAYPAAHVHAQSGAVRSRGEQLDANGHGSPTVVSTPTTVGAARTISSRQEGVLTLRFHAPPRTAASTAPPTHATPLVHTSAAFTPASRLASPSLPPTTTPSSVASAGSIGASATTHVTPATSATPSAAAPAAQATSLPHSSAMRMLDEYLAKYATAQT